MSDNDLRQFLNYLLAGIKQRFPKSKLRSETFLDADRLPATEELARCLLNDLQPGVQIRSSSSLMITSTFTEDPRP